MGYDYRGASSNPVGSVAPIGGPSYDIDRHGQGLSRPHARVQGHPRRPVLRPRLVDRQLRAPRQEHLGHEERRVDDRRVRHGPPVRRRPRPQVGRRSRAWPGPSYRRQNCTAAYGCVNPWREIYYDDAAGARAQVRPHQPLQPARRRASGRSATTARGPSSTRCSRTSSSPTPSRPVISGVDAQHADHLAQRRRAAGHDDGPGRRSPATSSSAGSSSR